MTFKFLIALDRSVRREYGNVRFACARRKTENTRSNQITDFGDPLTPFREKILVAITECPVLWPKPADRAPYISARRRSRAAAEDAEEQADRVRALGELLVPHFHVDGLY